MHQIKDIMEKLESAVTSEFSKGIDCIDTHEMGEVIDMIKDCSEALYYYSIYEAMKKSEEEKKIEELAEFKYFNGGNMINKYNQMRHDMPSVEQILEDYDELSPAKKHEIRERISKRFYPPYEEDRWVRYYDETPSHTSLTHMTRDAKEGMSGVSRKSYIETKDKYRAETPENKKMRTSELEKYLHELSSDITNMISDASIEEKNLLKQKLNALQQKI